MSLQHQVPLDEGADRGPGCVLTSKVRLYTHQITEHNKHTSICCVTWKSQGLLKHCNLLFHLEMLQSVSALTTVKDLSHRGWDSVCSSFLNIKPLLSGTCGTKQETERRHWADLKPLSIIHHYAFQCFGRRGCVRAACMYLRVPVQCEQHCMTSRSLLRNISPLLSTPLLSSYFSFLGLLPTGKKK